MVAASVSKNAAEFSDEESVDADGNQSANDEGHGVQIGHLTSRIEQREQEQGRHAAADRADHDFKGNEAATARTAMVLGEMALTARTSGH